MTGDAPSTGRAAVFLDRDGVLIAAGTRDGRPVPPATLEDVRVLPGVAAACTRLRAAGLLLVVVTNQPDIARGTADAGVVAAINREVQRLIPVDDVLVCPHDDPDGCDCRKPAPGLLLQAAARWGIDLRASVMVGDRWRDIEAGQQAGCRTVFVDRHYHEDRPRAPDLTVAELSDAVPWIITSTRTQGQAPRGQPSPTARPWTACPDSGTR